ncbi:MAG: hypothetical protein A3F84_12795 [Candidatus Handelsmanbacteria bacterium RIFCSPLOWO2_12_FULL_64_10]|uniref:Tyr recombinase domain-containing protein n=1 Tax=Handelsmanbacteria sp. (strain RIFCSPLOWO2_12_FULL_64_10) TaxID=1817868 RepID=A0A1F6CEZ8_HANXR|nr:MAG: hypothetical protein A3F84_12795 [Candidatus Handelsmanbacteria bacterium RIFCSPLOWO2_12_FULL_64_10]
MAVRKDEKSGKWLVDVWIGVHRIRRLLPDKRTAELLEKDLKVKEARGEYLGIREVKAVTFEAFSRDYLEYARTNLSPGRYDLVESVNRVALVPFFGPRYLKDITPKLVEDFKTEQAKRIKPSSVNEYLSILRAMFTLAVKWGHVKENPARHVKWLTVDAVEPPSLSAEESNRLLEVCREGRNLYTFTALGLNTGMRVGEILNLTWADVDLRRRIVKVRPKTEAGEVKAWRVKTGDLRDIPVNDALADVLSRHPRRLLKPEKQGEDAKASPYVLVAPDGGPYTREAMRLALEKAGKRAGLSIHVHPHLLRHTFGTTLAASGVDLDTIRRLMGHTDITMTMRYLHSAPNRLAGAVENLPFGRPIAQNLDSRAGGQNQRVT